MTAAMSLGLPLRGAQHNLTGRSMKLRGSVFKDVTNGSEELPRCHRDKAIVGGVDAQDHSLRGPGYRIVALANLTTFISTPSIPS